MSKKTTLSKSDIYDIHTNNAHISIIYLQRKYELSHLEAKNIFDAIEELRTSKRL